MSEVGVEQCVFEIIDSADSRDELNEKEIAHIKHFRATSGDLLNVANGGQYGAEVRGEGHHLAKLKEADVEKIIALLHQGDLTNTAISKLYGISSNTIDAIAKGRSWSHLPRPPGFDSTRRVSAETVIEILEQLDRGETIPAICRETGLTKATVTGIASGESWADIPRPVGYSNDTRRKRKLRPEDVDTIRELLAKGENYNTIAEMFGVTSSLIGRIKRGVAWAGR